MLTKTNLPTTYWSALIENIQIDYTQVNREAIAVLAAVSREFAVDLVMTFNRSVNVMKFKIFLEELRNRFPFDNILIMMDNLSVHRSLEVRDRLDELSFRWAFTPRYSPEFNGIEMVFAQSKRKIKKNRLHAI